MYSHKTKVDIILQEIEDDRVPLTQPKLQEVIISQRGWYTILLEIEASRVSLAKSSVQLATTQPSMPESAQQVTVLNVS